jgi:putative transposase
MKRWQLEALNACVMPQINMAQVDFIETTHITIVCKNCGSDQVIKWGTKRGIQQYWCKNCQRKFVANNALPGMRYPPECIASAINQFYEGLSLSAIQRHMEHDFQVKPSDATIYEWVTRFTQQALTGLSQMAPLKTGDLWAADETVLDVAGSQTKEGAENTIWFWDIIDEETKFLLASHMSERRTIRDAEGLFRQAASLVDRAPRFIITDKLRAYIDGIERVFGGDTVHIQSQGMATSTHNNDIERFHGTIKQRTKVMRGMKNHETSLLVMRGWLVHYNFFRPHETLNGKTPGEVAQANYPWNSWREVVAHGHIATEKRVTDRVPHKILRQAGTNDVL